MSCEMSCVKVFYGIQGNYKDVTDLVTVTDGYIDIPAGEAARSDLFTDPVYGTLKHILLEKDGKIELFPATKAVHFKITDQPSNKVDPLYILQGIHRKLKFVGGDITGELPEQIMAVMFIKPEHKVLEIGSNIGRNTLTIATLLNNQENLVTLESDINTCLILEQNKNINNYKFKIEPSALSYRRLIQKGWDTIPSDTLLPGYTPVNSITFQELEKKYNIQFDTLVADCEGALYYILLDYPDMLNNIKLFIVENDYHNHDHKKYVDNLLFEKGFCRKYYREGGWGPCYNNFFEVWCKCNA